MRDVKYPMKWLLKTKADIMKMLESARKAQKQATEDIDIWELMISDCDAEISKIQKEIRNEKLI